jgi:hypothetical protein
MAGSTESIRWELAECIARVKPHRLLIVMPPNKRSYRETYRYLNDILPNRIPESNTRATFIAFDDRWNPLVIKLKRPSRNERTLWTIGSKARLRILHLTLAPFFDRLAVENNTPHVVTENIERKFSG